VRGVRMQTLISVSVSVPRLRPRPRLRAPADSTTLGYMRLTLRRLLSGIQHGTTRRLERIVTRSRKVRPSCRSLIFLLFHRFCVSAIGWSAGRLVDIQPIARQPLTHTHTHTHTHTLTHRM